MKKNRNAFFRTLCLVVGCVLLLSAGLVGAMAADAEENGRAPDTSLVPESIRITGSKYVAQGYEITLKAEVIPATVSQKVTWESDDPEIAEISKKGVVTGLKKGKVKITASSRENPEISKTWKLEVKSSAAETVRISGAPKEMTENETVKLKASVLPEKAAQAVTWSSSDPDIATVSEKGKVTALRVGKVRITAKAADGTGKKASVTIKVTKGSEEAAEESEDEALGSVGTVRLFVPEESSDEEEDGVLGERAPHRPTEPLAVFGKDNRKKVKNLDSYPYTAIAYMTVVGRCGCQWTGTGFMVKQNKLMTAAHVMVCSKHSQWAYRIAFYFGYKDNYNYYYKYTGHWTAWAGNIFRTRVYTTTGDYACVKLDDYVGDTTGWFGLRWNISNAELRSTKYNLTGYRNGILRTAKGSVTASGTTFLNYKIDAEPGSSGCPIYTDDNYAIGINIAENTRTNIGYRLTQQVIDKLNDL